MIKRKIKNFIYFFKKKPTIKTSNDTLDFILKNKCSISRFGDGEFNLILSKNIYFQDNNKKIKKKLTEILLNNDNINHITCIPYTFINISCLEKKEAYSFWESYRYYNYTKIKKFLNFKKTYYDSLISRPYLIYKNKLISVQLFNKIKQIWNKKNVLIIEGKFSRSGVGNDLFQNANSLKRIIAPANNAFDYYNEIIESIKNHADKNTLILMALGPTATILAYDLSKLGFWAIDLGHLDMEYEWFLSKAEGKQPIKNKYVREGMNCNLIEKENDKEYNESIIQVIE